MSVNDAARDCSSSKNLDDLESPRKRMRLESSPRKSWSLMDRKTDQEVLQEMGVSLLEPDDTEGLYDSSSAAHPHKQAIRHKDIENVNPNVNSIMSPRKYSPKKMYSPSPGPSRILSPRSVETHKLHSSEHMLDTTIIDQYIIDEETPLAQSVSANYLQPGTGFTGKRTHSCTPLGLEEELIMSRRDRSEPMGADSFQVLSDEMMLSIFRWLPKRTLTHCMLVCKRWNRVACDETLWQRLDLGNKILNRDALGKVLARKPVIVRLANSEIGEWHTNLPTSPSRVQYLDLSACMIDLTTLDNLLERCPALKKLSLESIDVQDSTCGFIGQCANMETLNLSMARGITAEGLKALLTGCPGIQALNISWCDLSTEALEVLVTTLPSKLQRLNISGARIMTDDMVSQLVVRCPRLVELDLSDCSRLGVAAVRAVLSLSRLDHLALSRCYLLPAHALTKLSSMASLQYLDVWGMLQNSSLNALRSALPAIQINQFMFSAIARPTVGTRRTSIWGLRTRD